MSYRLKLSDRMKGIVVVGCGGTGGFVAESLCRLIEPERPLVLIDYDKVEPRNLRRQNFYKPDLERFKSQALAERLARNYQRPVAYSVMPVGQDSSFDPYSCNDRSHILNAGIVIGCVDRASGRKAIQKSINPNSWWIDAGNGRDSGQVLIGNRMSHPGDRCRYFAGEVVQYLPLPTIQQPSLLMEAEDPKPTNCAQAVEAEEQSRIINQAMAVLVIEFVDRLLSNRLEWMQAYIDLEAGTRTTVAATPENVARMLKVKVNQIVERPKKAANRVRVRA